MDFLNYPPHPDGPAAELQELVRRHNALKSAYEAAKEVGDASLASHLGRSLKRLRRRARHSLAWEPGQYGKGMKDVHGSVYTWPVDENYEPNHQPYAQEHGIEHDRPYFFINPDGRVDLGGQDPTAAQDIPKIDPRLNLDPGEYWGGALDGLDLEQ